MIHGFQVSLTGSSEVPERKKPREINLAVPGTYAFKSDQSILLLL